MTSPRFFRSGIHIVLLWHTKSTPESKNDQPGYYDHDISVWATSQHQARSAILPAAVAEALTLQNFAHTL